MNLFTSGCPKDYGRYIEVFGGGGWVLFGRKPDASMEVYNDYNADLANLFRCVKERPLALLKELNFLPINGRDEFNVLKKYLEKEEFTNEYLKRGTGTGGELPVPAAV